MNIYDNGITLISLVISIIVIFLLSIISFDMLLGENGILTEAKDARIVKKLSEDLFDFQSNMVKERLNNRNAKLKLIEILSRVNKDNKKYSLNFFEDLDDNVASISNIEIQMINSRTDPKIKLNGDVFLNNNIRGKIKLTENVEKILLKALEFGDFDVTVYDGNLEFDEKLMLVTVSSNSNHPVFWVNQFGEILGFCKEIYFSPIGGERFEIIELDLLNLVNGVDKIYDLFNNRCPIHEGTYFTRIENGWLCIGNAQYYSKTFDLILNDEMKIKMRGVSIQEYGLYIGKTLEELKNSPIKFSFKRMSNENLIGDDNFISIEKNGSKIKIGNNDLVNIEQENNGIYEEYYYILSDDIIRQLMENERLNMIYAKPYIKYKINIEGTDNYSEETYTFNSSIIRTFNIVNPKYDYIKEK